MSMDSAYLSKALTRWNYFPNQKTNGEEIPPIFSSRQFTPEVANDLVKEKLRKDGYDQVDYYATRHNNVVRPLSIPHPTAYANLVHCICENWQKLSYIAENENSLIKPEEHPDGRALIMDYEDAIDRTVRALEKGFGKSFRVHTDISNCFPTVYSHAIPWATVGFKHAKQHKGPRHSKEWFNRLDFLVRMTKRNETQGVAIGPGTSNVVSEAILAKIDERLRAKYTFFRYIDDYTCYANSFDDAQNFIRELNDELRLFKMSLNLKKTTVLEMPAPIDEDWVIELSTRMPVGRAEGSSSADKRFTAHEAIRFIEFSLGLRKSAPDGSVVKFAVKSVIYRLQENAVEPVLEFLLILARHYPLLLPLLLPLLTHVEIKPAPYARHLNFILAESALNRRSDGMCWTIYLLAKCNLPLSHEMVQKVIETKDCLAILLLHSLKSFEEEVKTFVDSIDKQDAYELDRYWVLFYQRFIDKSGPNPYTDDKTFDILSGHQVSFMPEDGVTTPSETKILLDELGFVDETGGN